MPKTQLTRDQANADLAKGQRVVIVSDKDDTQWDVETHIMIAPEKSRLLAAGQIFALASTSRPYRTANLGSDVLPAERTVDELSQTIVLSETNDALLMSEQKADGTRQQDIELSRSEMITKFIAYFLSNNTNPKDPSAPSDPIALMEACYDDLNRRNLLSFFGATDFSLNYIQYVRTSLRTDPAKLESFDAMIKTDIAKGPAGRLYKFGGERDSPQMLSAIQRYYDGKNQTPPINPARIVNYEYDPKLNRLKISYDKTGPYGFELEVSLDKLGMSLGEFSGAKLDLLLEVFYQTGALPLMMHPAIQVTHTGKSVIPLANECFVFLDDNIAAIQVARMLGFTTFHALSPKMVVSIASTIKEILKGNPAAPSKKLTLCFENVRAVLQGTSEIAEQFKQLAELYQADYKPDVNYRTTTALGQRIERLSQMLQEVDPKLATNLQESVITYEKQMAEINRKHTNKVAGSTDELKTLSDTLKTLEEQLNLANSIFKYQENRYFNKAIRHVDGVLSQTKAPTLEQRLAEQVIRPQNPSTEQTQLIEGFARKYAQVKEQHEGFIKQKQSAPPKPTPPPSKWSMQSIHSLWSTPPATTAAAPSPATDTKFKQNLIKNDDILKLQLAAYNRNWQALQILATIYQDGIIVPANLMEARACLQLALLYCQKPEGMEPLFEQLRQVDASITTESSSTPGPACQRMSEFASVAAFGNNINVLLMLANLYLKLADANKKPEHYEQALYYLCLFKDQAPPTHSELRMALPNIQKIEDTLPPERVRATYQKLLELYGDHGSSLKSTMGEDMVRALKKHYALQSKPAETVHKPPPRPGR